MTELPWLFYVTVRTFSIILEIKPSPHRLIIALDEDDPQLDTRALNRANIRFS